MVVDVAKVEYIGEEISTLVYKDSLKLSNILVIRRMNINSSSRQGWKGIPRGGNSMWEG